MAMNIKKFLLSDLKYKGTLGFYACLCLYRMYILYFGRGGKKSAIDRSFMRSFGHPVNWEKPRTLNEKIQWLKLYGYEDFHTICADKYRMREYLHKKLNTDDYQIPILYKTDDWRDITLDVIPDEPCVIKANHTQGDVWIVKDKSEVDIKKLRTQCHWAFKRNLYNTSFEPQYRDIKPMIIIEKLLQDEGKKIPNDYKFHYINGELQFIYCAVDREGINKRNIYDANWNPLFFTWSEKYKDSSTLRGPEIDAPKSFEKMKELASVIAQDFKYVRVDFYEVNGMPYFGEITLHHGSGYDVFVPDSYDMKYGDLLRLE